MAAVPGAYTQCGYPVIANYGDPELVSNPIIPGTNGVKVYGGLRAGATATVLLYVAARWNNEVEKLQQVYGIWGYDKRNIRGGSGWSNHAGGCAVDLNASRHPQHAQHTFTAAQVVKIHAIIAVCKVNGVQVVRWGGDWTISSIDEMHDELAPGQSGSPTEALAALIKAGKVPNVPKELLAPGVVPGNPVVTPKPIPAPVPNDPKTTYKVVKGDTLGEIAAKFKTTVAVLTNLNNLANPNVIYIGQVLKLPTGTTPPKPSTPTAPAFPLPSGYYYGPYEGPNTSISGFGKNDDKYRAGLAQWQQQMKNRGWKIKVDGYYGPQTSACAQQFQLQCGLSRDGLIGPSTWKAAWTAPVS